MDYGSTLHEFSNLGPALGSVVVIGLIAYHLVKLIKVLSDKLFFMFDQHTKALYEMRHNMEGHTIIIKTVADNVKENTKVTKQAHNSAREMVKIMKKMSLSYKK